MTALLALPKDEFIGKKVPGEIGTEFVINDTNDLAEWLANMYGVITVNNDDPDHPSDKMLLRLAASADPVRYTEAMKRLEGAFHEIKTGKRLDRDVKPAVNTDPTPEMK